MGVHWQIFRTRERRLSPVATEPSAVRRLHPDLQRAYRLLDHGRLEDGMPQAA